MIGMDGLEEELRDEGIMHIGGTVKITNSLDQKSTFLTFELVGSC